MELEIDFLKNNYLVEPILTFVVVPHRRYTLPFVTRNIYVQDLGDYENYENNENENEDTNPDTEPLLKDGNYSSDPAKDKFSQILNNIFANLMRETKNGIAKRGKVLKKKLDLRRRARSAGYYPRDRFHLCSPCKKFQKLRSDLSRLKGPAVQKIKNIIKARGRKMKESFDPEADILNKKENHRPKFKTSTYESLEKRKQINATRTRIKPANSNPNSRLVSTVANNNCPVFKLLEKLKEDVVHLYKDKKENKVVHRNSSFYVDEYEDEGHIERRRLI